MEYFLPTKNIEHELIEFIRKSLIPSNINLCGKAIGVEMPNHPLPKAFPPNIKDESSEKNILRLFLEFIQEVWDLYTEGEDYDPSVFDIPHTQLEFLPGRYEDPAIIPLLMYFLHTPDTYRVFVYTEGADEKKTVSRIVLLHLERDEMEIFEGEECTRFLGNFFRGE